MRSQITGAITLLFCASIFIAVVVFPVHAQEAMDNDNRCPETTEYSEARSLHVLGVDDCQELTAWIESATEQFFRGQCDILEARNAARRASTFNVANTNVESARSRFFASASLYAVVSEQIEAEFSFPESEELSDARNIFEFYGYEGLPSTYSEAFGILAAEIENSGDQLKEVYFSGDGHSNRHKRILYDASSRAGSIFRAIEIILNLQAA